MPADVKPSTWLGNGYTVDAANHLIKFNTNDSAVMIPPIRLLSQLTDAKADPTTGDVRDVLFAICEMAWQVWITQQGLSNVPVFMQMNRYINSGGTTETAVYNYQFSFTVNTPTGVQALPAET